jgi:hypothetical protein
MADVYTHLSRKVGAVDATGAAGVARSPIATSALCSATSRSSDWQCWATASGAPSLPRAAGGECSPMAWSLDRKGGASRFITAVTAFAL